MSYRAAHVASSLGFHEAGVAAPNTHLLHDEPQRCLAQRHLGVDHLDQPGHLGLRTCWAGGGKWGQFVWPVP